MFANYKPVKRAVLKQGATQGMELVGVRNFLFSAFFFSLIYCSLVLHNSTDGICFKVFNKFVSLTLLLPKETASVNEWGVIFLWRRNKVWTSSSPLFSEGLVYILPSFKYRHLSKPVLLLFLFTERQWSVGKMALSEAQWRSKELWTVHQKVGACDFVFFLEAKRKRGNCDKLIPNPYPPLKNQCQPPF